MLLQALDWANMSYMDVRKAAIEKGVEKEKAMACNGRGRLFLELHHVGLSPDTVAHALTPAVFQIHRGDCKICTR